MSASSSVDAFDAQMLDFSSDPDVPMHLTGSAEFFAEALMDHDGHLAASAYSEHASVEVDMEEYLGDNAEYEMTDETIEYHRLHGDELLDIEVHDASRLATPLVPPQPLQPSVDVAIDSERPDTAAQAFSAHPTHPEASGEPQSEVHPAPLDHPAADGSHVEPSASGESVVLEVVASEPSHPSDARDKSVPLISESHEQQGDVVRASDVDAVDKAELHVPPVAEEYAVPTEVAQQENSEPPAVGSVPSSEEAYGALAQDEKATEQVPVTEEESVDPLHISDGVYIDPPPAVLLSVASLTEPEFALFNLPEVAAETANEYPDSQKGYSLLLEDRPTLYYEPLSSVFEVLRQEEGLLSRIPHSFEGELALDAYDLQLVVSEDNVHSREISLHDLNILHDGSDFAGPLRLILRAIVPRFIIRYYALQEQVQRLHLIAETGEEEHVEEHREHYEAAEEQPVSQSEADGQLPTQATIASDLLPTTETEKSDQEHILPSESTDELQENYEDTSAPQEQSTEYHAVTEEVVHALEDENDYEGTNVGDEDEASKSESLDADQVHDTVAEDTDAAATVGGHETEFDGEQTEYVDYVQPEEYEERYGEDLPERAGEASLVQYDEPSHHEEEEEQDASTAVDETQAISPGLNEDEAEGSTTTAVPPRAVLELESSEPVDGNANDEPVISKPENPSNEKLETSESTDEVNQSQTSSDQEPSALQARIFSDIDESDSNFVAMLERDADAEFERTFSAEQNGQDVSTEAPFPHVETWDEDEWDDADAEGVDEEDWIDPDADSNESSVTLSSLSKASKRSFGEVEPGDEPEENLQNSPGSKRPRVL